MWPFFFSQQKRWQTRSVAAVALRHPFFLFFLRFSWLMEIAGKLKLLEVCTATPNPDCGCSRGLNHLFCSYCYGNGSNHLIFVTRIKIQGALLWIQTAF
ncbi:hypothetical protein NC653_028846 [Populus alba x Populus x berolinensis]|uniref:Uncharacterized protein n=1 Tax=Populus alba x Populus x berolinensis TaxID=444605 RepID=A0AAD6M3H4_9ROSI|nr:hypothetical protein NC653_028846 [Populus alba x Populus x berolinensis]